MTRTTPAAVDGRRRSILRRFGRKLNYEDYETFSLARFLACAARVLDRAATRLLA